MSTQILKEDLIQWMKNVCVSFYWCRRSSVQSNNTLMCYSKGLVLWLTDNQSYSLSIYRVHLKLKKIKQKKLQFQDSYEFNTFPLLCISWEIHYCTEIHLTHRERGQIQHVPRVTVQEHVHSKRASVMTCLLHAYATLKKWIKTFSPHQLNVILKDLSLRIAIFAWFKNKTHKKSMSAFFGMFFLYQKEKKNL